MSSKIDKVVLIWLNPDRTHHSQARLLQTFSTPSSTPTPFCFNLEDIKASKIASEAFFVHSEQDFIDFLPKSTKNTPLVVSTALAEEILGWKVFQPSKYAG